MGNTIKKRLKIMIIEDEEDILILYNDYLILTKRILED